MTQTEGTSQFKFRNLDELAHDEVDSYSEQNRTASAPLQIVSPVCYGRGLKLTDMEVPPIPEQCKHLLDEDQSDPELAPFLRRRGRGRADALKHSQHGQEEAVKPGGLSHYTQQQPNRLEHRPDEKSNGSTNLGSSIEWTISPPNVVDFHHLPRDLELEVLHDMVAYYGTILNYQEKRLEGSVSVRFKMKDPSSCASIVSNFDGTDFLGSGQNLECIQIDA